MKKRIMQSAKRPQAYVPDGRIATGQDKARMKGRKLDMRGWWKDILTRNGWLNAIEAFHTTMPLKSDPILAFINHGRWVALCPDCAGQEVVDPNDPVFICLSCGNIGNKHGGIIRLHPVKFPALLEREQIEQTLLKRDAIHRNWNSDKETLDDLRKENKEHGLG